MRNIQQVSLTVAENYISAVEENPRYIATTIFRVASQKLRKRKNETRVCLKSFSAPRNGLL